MPTTSTRRTVVAIACIAASTACAQPSLYGVTVTNQADDTSTLVRIDPTTGLATLLFTLSVPDGFVASCLTFHQTQSRLVLLLRRATPDGSFRLGLIDPIARTIQVGPTSTVPSGSAFLESIGYDAPNDQLLITHGPSTRSTRLSSVDPSGSILQTSAAVVGADDLDNVEYDRFNDRLLSTDLNALTGNPRVFSLVEPLTLPIASPLFDPPRSNDVGDIAVDPTDGSLFAIGVGAWVQSLVAVNPTSYLPLGNYGIGENVIAIAFAEFIAPCAPDLTTTAVPGSPGYGVPNGVLNNDDFFYYLTQFAAGNLTVADLTTTAVPGSSGYGVPNGVLNNDDFFYYLTLFAAGC